MKLIIRFLITIILFFTFVRTNAQNLDTVAIHWALSYFHYSDVVIEGMVIDDVTYTEYHTPFHAYTIQISKIFKGMDAITCGTLIALKMGGQDSLGNGAGMAHGDAFFPVGSVGIFFLNIEDGKKQVPIPSTIVNSSTNKPTWFSFVDNAPSYGGISYQPSLLDSANWNEYFSYFAGGFDGLHFNNFDEVYQFAKNLYGVDSTLFVDCELLIAITARKFPPVIYGTKKPDPEIKEQNRQAPKLKDEKLNSPEIKKKDEAYLNYLRKEEIIRQMPHPLNKTNAGEAITFTMANETYTKSGVNRFIEFDIMIKANSTSFYHEKAPIWITYNNAAFGSSIYSAGNVTATKGISFGTSTYILAQTDQNPNTYSVDVTPPIPYYSSTMRTLITTTPKVYVHLKIKINTCYNNTDIQYTNTTGTENVTIYTVSPTDTNLTAWQFINSVTYSNPLTMKLCEPVITNITPTTITGGTGSMITISGKYFGATRGNGQIKFPNANDGGQTYVQILDNVDYVTWNDTIVKLKVPNNSDTATTLSIPFGAKNYVAGSGSLIVKTDLNDTVIISTPITITYSIKGQKVTNLPLKGLNTLTNQNGQGSYNIWLDTSVSNHILYKSAVIKAIRHWNCKTKSNLVYVGDTIISTNLNDNINVIYFKSIGSSAVMITNGYSSYCGFSSTLNYQFYNTGFDMNISTAVKWQVDTVGNKAIDIDSSDFYSVLLHELGHALGLSHVMDSVNDFMWWQEASHPTPALNRYALKWGQADVGVKYIVTQSEAQTIIGGCAYVKFISKVETNCSYLYGINNKGTKTESNIRVFPNPNNGSFKFEGIEEVTQIRIIDMTGKEINFTRHENEVNINSAAKGLYLIQFYKKDELIESQKIVIN